MPELPEVETVRIGLERWVLGRTITEVDDLHPRAVRRHVGGAADLRSRLRNRTITAVHRRGKYLWLVLDGPSGDGGCLIAHLGMSGQLLVLDPSTEPGPHLRARFSFADQTSELRFVDQRTFGGLQYDDLVADGPTLIPSAVAHIARDPLDPLFDDEAWVASVRRRNTTIKRVLLDQTSISGIGNIYADESLWRAQLHGDRLVGGLTRPALRRLLVEIRGVLTAALRAGGTSFDALYVNVNGQSGYFDRSLNVYGQEGRACPRCATPIRRQRWMNRSSFFCPRCQRPPRAVPTSSGASRKALTNKGHSR